MKIKKLIAPILISAFCVLWMVLWAAIYLFVPGLPILFKILGIAVPFVLAWGMLFVLRERIQEIRSGEEDDLSNY